MCEHHDKDGLNRRQALRAGLAATVRAEDDPYAEPAEPALPPSDMQLDLSRTALVVTDPQIDFLSPEGVTWAWSAPASSITTRSAISNACSRWPRNAR